MVIIAGYACNRVRVATFVESERLKMDIFIYRDNCVCVILCLYVYIHNIFFQREILQWPKCFCIFQIFLHWFIFGLGCCFSGALTWQLLPNLPPFSSSEFASASSFLHNCPLEIHFYEQKFVSIQYWINFAYVKDALSLVAENYLTFTV